jgi:hypothetical protein
MRTRGNEAGKGALSAIFWLAVLVGGVYAGVNVIPLYTDHWAFQDKMVEFARLPKYRNNDEEVTAKIMKEVRERRMDCCIQPADIKVHVRDTSRAITIEYERPAKYLPGTTAKPIHFSVHVDEPIPF